MFRIGGGSPEVMPPERPLGESSTRSTYFSTEACSSSSAVCSQMASGGPCQPDLRSRAGGLLAYMPGASADYSPMPARPSELCKPALPKIASSESAAAAVPIQPLLHHSLIAAGPYCRDQTSKM